MLVSSCIVVRRAPSFPTVIIESPLLLFYFVWLSEAYRRQARCYKCDGNNEQCSLAMMHSDIAKYTVRCPRDYDNCLTVFLEQDGRKIFNKRCASDRICNRETSRCGGSERATKGGLQTEKICHAWCCKGDWCNPGPRVSPAHLVMMSGLLFVNLMCRI